MSKPVSDDFKARALQAGLWKAFNERRDELKAEGFPPAKAKNQAVEEFEAKLAEIEGGHSDPPASPLSVLSFPSLPPSDDLCFDESVFEGRPSVGIVQAIQWVARNLEAATVLPTDAPSPEAWGMLISYRRSPTRKNEFWDKIFSRLIPSKAQLKDDTDADEIDDAGMVGVIDRLIELRKEVAA